MYLWDMYSAINIYICICIFNIFTRLLQLQLTYFNIFIVSEEESESALTCSLWKLVFGFFLEVSLEYSHISH